MKKIYKSFGKTPKEAVANLWDLMQYTDDYCYRSEDGGCRIMIVVVPPTKEQRELFEVTLKEG